MMKKIGISLLCSLLFCTLYVGCKSSETDNSIKVEKEYNKAIFNSEYTHGYGCDSCPLWVDVEDYTIADNNIVYITATDGRKYICGFSNVMLIYDEKGNK